MEDYSSSYLSGVDVNSSLKRQLVRRTQVIAWLRTHKERADTLSGVLITPKLDQELIGLGERLIAIDAKIKVLDDRESKVLGGLKPQELANRAHLREQLNKTQKRIGIVNMEKANKKAVFAAKKQSLENALRTLNYWTGYPADSGM